MSKQMTAVEWLEQEFLMTNGKLTFTEFKQAKEMEMIQHEKTWNAALGSEKDFEEYYNKTFNK